jgi:hypothetical protein
MCVRVYIVYRLLLETNGTKRGGTYLNFSNRNSRFRCKTFSVWSERFPLQNVLQQTKRFATEYDEFINHKFSLIHKPGYTSNGVCVYKRGHQCILDLIPALRSTRVGELGVFIIWISENRT